MKTEKRRTFIKRSMMASAGVVLGPAYIKGYIQQKPSEVINVAVIGLHDRGGLYAGSGHTANYTKMKETRVAAICDCVESLFPNAIKDIEDLGGARPKTYVDYRDMLKDKDIDVVSIAAPDYWHALMTINACQAGKDVYVEKPISYNIDEGRKMVQAARKYNRIVQAGTERRSNRLTRKAIQMLREGVIGDIYMGRGIVYRLRPNIGKKPDSEVPKGVNWDLFRGPAPMIPFNENHFLYNWHWYWETMAFI
jgi:predicted dehydrogenase